MSFENGSNSNTPDNRERDAAITVRSEEGVVRVSIGPRGQAPTAPEEAPVIAPTAQVRQGAVRVDPHTGERTNLDINRASVSGAADPTGQSGVLATARSKFGGPAHELTPTTMVTLPNGMDVELRVAEKAGFVRRQGSAYVEVNQLEQGAAESDAEAKIHPYHRREAVDFHPQIEQDLAQIAAGTDQRTLDEVTMKAALAYAEHGSVEHVSPEKIASLTGWPVERAQLYVLAADAAYRGQEAAVLDSLGIQPEEYEAFRDWARSEKPRDWQRAVVEHRHARTLSAYHSLADQFLRSMPPSQEALNAAGFETRVDAASGRLLMRIDGMWLPVATAARQGLI